MKVRIVSFATPGPYAKEAKRLVASAQEHMLSVTVDEVTFRLDDVWRSAVMHKPAFILSKLNSLEKGEDGLLWTDADSVFRRAPDWSIFDGVDFACHVFKRNVHHEPEMLTGTMYFANQSHVRVFVQEWMRETEKYRHTDTPEQRSLAEVYDKWKNNRLLLFKELGPEWCWIFDDSLAIYGPRSVIVEHHQASRRLRT